MRTGQNPLRKAEAPESFPPVLAAVITHLPKETGYHAKRLEVVQACLKSLRAFGRCPVLVWDNGSGPKLRKWLQEEFKPEYLVQSPNIGKSSARAAILRMLPPKTIVAVSDDDILYYPGWLDAHLTLLRGFPNVGAVSGWPVRVCFGWAYGSTVRWAQEQENATVQYGRWIPDQEEVDYAVSVGLDPEKYLRSTLVHQDIRIKYGKLAAYAEAQHCQFACYAGRIAPLAEWDSLAMAPEHPFDHAIDRAGLLRLTTIQRCTRHMGNVLDDRLTAEVARLKL